MRKTSEVIKNSSISPKLIWSVIRQLGGTESLQDIARHGIDGGFGGFIYYKDTFAFYKRNRKEINALVEDIAREFGENEIDFVASFRCIQHVDSFTRHAIMVCLGGGRLPNDDYNIDAVANALSWFAAETVAQEFCNG